MAFWGFPRYVCKAEKQAKAAQKLEQLRKKRDVKPVILHGSAIARTWWGKAWNQNLERYADYSNRIGRGRSYVRHGAVLDLQIREGEISALVQGSRSRPYEVSIAIKRLPKATWRAVTASSAGMIESLSELMEGKFPKAMAEIFMRQGTGLFPAPKEISLQCSCPDWATMCKHVAATLYGVGARLDDEPNLFFTLRGVDISDLLSRTLSTGAERLLEKASRKSSRIIADSDLAGMFGIELASPAEKSAREPAGKAARIAAVAEKRKKTAKKTAQQAASVKRSVRKTAISPGTGVTRNRTLKAKSGKPRVN